MRKMIDSGVEWLGAIPKDWDLVQIKSIASCKSEKSSYIGGAYIGLEHIESGSGKLLADGSQTGIEVDSTVSSFSDTDILFGKLRPYLAKVAKPNFDGQCSTEILVLNPSSRIQKDFLFWYLLNPAFIDAVNASTYGAKMPRANWDFIGSCYLPLPPMNMQTVISSVLNEKFAQVDALVSNVQAQIEKLKVYKQSLITEVVTKGIAPTVPMKDSGAGWIGEIPAHWDMKRGKTMFQESGARSADGSEELLTVSQYTGITPRSQKNVNMFEALSLEGYKICNIGDIAANTMWMWAGAIGVSKYYGVISPSYNVYHQIGTTYHPQYLDYLLRIPPLVQCYESQSTGIRASRLRLYPQQFLNICFPVPPLAEQEAIVAELESRCRKVDQLIVIKQKKIDKLNEYKKSLIYEYVTGKREVS